MKDTILTILMDQKISAESKLSFTHKFFTGKQSLQVQNLMKLLKNQSQEKIKMIGMILKFIFRFNDIILEKGESVSSDLSKLLIHLYCAFKNNWI